MNSKIIDIILPDLGEGIEGAEVSEISVKVGDTVSNGDTILVLESDKASMEIPTEVSGTVKEVLVQPGAEVKVGTVLAKIEGDSSQETTPDAETIEDVKHDVPENNEPTELKTIDIILPDLGEGIEGAEVSEISVKVGDTVSNGDTILVLESDKASMEIPTEVSGTVKEVLVQPGAEVKVGTVLAKIEGDSSQETTPDAGSTEEVTSELETPKETTSDKQPDMTTVFADDKDKLFASPSVRRLSRELGISLQLIPGTGKKGRITKDDLNAHIKRQMAADRKTAVSINNEVDYSQWGNIEEVKLSKIKKITGKRLQEAWQGIPHVTQFDTADITDLDLRRREINNDLQKKNIKTTFLPFLMKATVEALKAMPEFNSSLNHTGETLILKNYYNIGIAVDTPNGLVVPVIKDVDSKDIVQLSEELLTTSKSARNGKLKPSDLKGGTFTISSLGGIGGSFFTPIINPPEVGILGISKSRWEQIYDPKSEKSFPRYIMPFSLSYDHRIIDGAAGARFTNELKKILEELVFLDK